MTRTLAIVAVVLSVAALALSIYNTARADDLAAQAAAERERAAVERLKPHVLVIYEDFETEDLQTARNAETFDELLTPLFKMTQSIR